MRRIARLTPIALLVTCSACCSPRLPEPNLVGTPCVAPKSCPAADATSSVAIQIGAEGTTNPPCVTIDPRKNPVYWSAAPGVEFDQLRIRFKTKADVRMPPHDPLCSGPLCFMPTTIEHFDEGPYCYAIVYRVPGEEARTIDPMLIIKHLDP